MSTWVLRGPSVFPFYPSVKMAGLYKRYKRWIERTSQEPQNAFFFYRRMSSWYCLVACSRLEPYWNLYWYSSWVWRRVRIQPASIANSLTTGLPSSFLDPASIVEQGKASTLADNVIGRVDITTSKPLPPGPVHLQIHCFYFSRLCWSGVEHR